MVHNTLSGGALSWLTWPWPLRWTPSRRGVSSPPSVMDHRSDPCDLTITANHGDSLCYYNDRQWFGPGVFGWWMEAHTGSWESESQAGWSRCSMSIDSTGTLSSCSHLYHNEVEILNPGVSRDLWGSLILMFKVTPLRETPTHCLTIFPDHMLISLTSDWAGWLPHLLKEENDEPSYTC